MCMHYNGETCIVFGSSELNFRREKFSHWQVFIFFNMLEVIVYAYVALNWISAERNSHNDKYLYLFNMLDVIV